MKTRQQLLDEVTLLAVQKKELERVQEEQKSRILCLGKDLESARAEAALCRENLARALGYIDRINDLERPPATPYVQPVTPAANSGPVIKSPTSAPSRY